LVASSRLFESLQEDTVPACGVLHVP
jgi:hypothetical protein